MAEAVRVSSGVAAELLLAFVEVVLEVVPGMGGFDFAAVAGEVGGASLSTTTFRVELFAAAVVEVERAGCDDGEALSPVTGLAVPLASLAFSTERYDFSFLNRW